MLKTLQVETYYPPKLRRQIETHNDRVHQLTLREESIQGRKADLVRRATSGKITGAAALEERAQIDRDARSVDVDAIPLLAERSGFVEAIRAAHNAEADRLATLAAKRRREIEEKTADVLSPELREQAVRSDGQFRVLDTEARNARGRAMTAHSAPDDAVWRRDALVRIEMSLR